MKKTALIVVDMQKYYLHEEADFYRYAEERMKGCMHYIKNRVTSIVIPNIQILLTFFREKGLPVIFLRLCSKRKNRKDLHRFFYTEHIKAVDFGYPALYPHSKESMGDILEQLTPLSNEKVFTKTTFSAFSSTNIKHFLKRKNIGCCVFTGLATSQCVETTARDASDSGFSTVHIENAQADYNEDSHYSSLFSSRSVCGAWIYETAHFTANYENLMETIFQEEYCS